MYIHYATVEQRGCPDNTTNLQISWYSIYSVSFSKKGNKSRNNI